MKASGRDGSYLPVSREFTVSKSACDFHAGPGGYLLDNLGSGMPPEFDFTVNNPNGYSALGAKVNFQSGDKIYVSVRNYNYNNGSPVPTCPVPISPTPSWSESKPNPGAPTVPTSPEP